MVISSQDVIDYDRSVPFLPELPKTGDKQSWERYWGEVLEHRIRVNWEVEKSEDARMREIARVVQSGAYWVNTYGAIYEARPDLYAGWEDRSDLLPFVMYPFQVAVWDWLMERKAGRGNDGDGLIVKSRDMGLSNIAAAFAAYLWLTTQPFQGRLMSRIERLVDAPGDPDSLFWKLETNLKAMPDWMMQYFAKGFDWKYHRQVMKLINPANGNMISGESTQVHAGRGGRGTMFILDEYGTMENGDQIWTNTRASTPHRIAISTVNVSEGMHMYNLHYGLEGYIQPPVLELPWYVHPLHDQKWFMDEMSRDTPEGFQREVLMNYFAGTGEWVYPQTHSFEVGKHPFSPYDGPLFAAIDDGWSDRFVIHWIQYVKSTGRHRLIDSYTNKHKAISFYGTIMTGIPRDDFGYTSEEKKLMEWVRGLPGIIYVGDTHGYNKEPVTGQAPFEVLSQDFGINVLVDYEKRTHKDRRTKLGEILTMFDFNDTPGCERVLWSLKRNRFKKSKPGQDLVREAREPVHDDTSHDVSSLEYYATAFEQFRNMFTGTQINWTGQRSRG